MMKPRNLIVDLHDPKLQLHEEILRTQIIRKMCDYIYIRLYLFQNVYTKDKPIVLASKSEKQTFLTKYLFLKPKGGKHFYRRSFFPCFKRRCH